MRPGADSGPRGPLGCRCLGLLGLLHVVSNLEDGGHGGLHPAGLVDAGLGLEVASGLELQAFIGALRDAGAPAEGLFEPSTEPVQQKQHRFVLLISLKPRLTLLQQPTWAWMKEGSDDLVLQTESLSYT